MPRVSSLIEATVPELPDSIMTRIPNFASVDFAPAMPQTPAPIVRKLGADIAQVAADPEFKNALAARGFEAQSSAPEQLADFLDRDYVKFRDLIQRLGLQVE